MPWFLPQEVKLFAPVTRWSQQCLAQRRSKLRNDFEVKAILAYLQACGVSASVARATRFEGANVIHTIALQGPLR